jgi:hypothetical protein
LHLALGELPGPIYVCVSSVLSFKPLQIGWEAYVERRNISAGENDERDNSGELGSRADHNIKTNVRRVRLWITWPGNMVSMSIRAAG